MLYANCNAAEEETMSVRLVITFRAEPGKGSELAAAMKERCVTSAKDAGCLQFLIDTRDLRARDFARTYACIQTG